MTNKIILNLYICTTKDNRASCYVLGKDRDDARKQACTNLLVGPKLIYTKRIVNEVEVCNKCLGQAKEEYQKDCDKCGNTGMLKFGKPIELNN